MFLTSLFQYKQNHQNNLIITQRHIIKKMSQTIKNNFFLNSLFQKQNYNKNHQQITIQMQPHCTLALKTKTPINVDCVKVCPMDKDLWVLCFYQQNLNNNIEQFLGGVQIINTEQHIINNLSKGNKNEVDIGIGKTQPENKGYVELGPLMHVQWLDTTSISQNQQKYYLMAVSRCNDWLLLSYSLQTKQIKIQKRQSLGQNIFILYCDIKLLPQSQSKSQSYSDTNQFKCKCVSSTNQSLVSLWDLSIGKDTCQIVGEIQQLKKHQYAVWACKLSPCAKYLVVGDEVCSVYLYHVGGQGECVRRDSQAHSQGICQVAWWGSQIVISGGFDGNLCIFKAPNLELLRRVALGGTIWRIICFSSEVKNVESGEEQNVQFGSFLICNSSEKKFQIHNLDSKQKTLVWDSQGQHTSLAYSADYNGHFIITSSFYDQKVCIWQNEQKK